MKHLWWKISFYFVMFLVVLYMSINEYSRVSIVGTAVMATLIFFLIHFIYPLVLEKRVDRVESFLRSQKNMPGLYINYVFANRLEDEAKTIMEQLMRKYKKVAAQASYKAAYGFYRKDMTAIKEAVPYIRNSDHRTYYETILLLEEGESARARQHLESIKKPWMRSALLAAIELKADCIETAVKHAGEALNSSRGVQHYMLHKEYERVLPQAFNIIIPF